MDKENGLFEELVALIGVEFLSELNVYYRRPELDLKLIRALKKIDVTKYSARKWMDAFDYFTGFKTELTPKDIKQEAIEKQMKKGMRFI